jgi:hypothetical protein
MEGTTELPMKEKEQLTIQQTFKLPTKVKRAKIIIATLELLSGAFMFSMALLYLLQDSVDKTTTYTVLAYMFLIIGIILIALGPYDVVKAVNTALVLKPDEVQIRNSIGWQVIPWEKIQQILIIEKLKKNPKENKEIGIRYIRFREVDSSTIFKCEDYPVEETQEMIPALEEAFEQGLSDTTYTVNSRVERPSVTSRFLFYERTVEK